MTDINWTPELREYLDAVQSALEHTGIEMTVRAGIMRDLEAQIAEMRAEEGLSDGDILSSLDPPEEYIATFARCAPDNPVPYHEQPAPAASHVKNIKRTDAVTSIAGMVLYIFAIILSLAAVLTELSLRVCAGTFGDPLPSILHVAGFLAVPATLAITLVILKVGVSRASLRWTHLLNGFVTATTLWYTMMFLPVMPLSAMLLPFFFTGFGLFGLLPFAPGLSLIAAFRQRSQLKKHRPEGSMDIRTPRWWFAGVAVAVVMFGGWEAWQYSVSYEITQAITGDAETRRAAITALKRLHAEKLLLERCYGITRFGGAPRGKELILIGARYGQTMRPAAYQALYYLLTGQDYREAPRPFSVISRFGSGAEEEFFERSGTGGDEVGVSSRKLSLKSAQIDVSASSSPDGKDAGPGLAYAEYTLEFVNDASLAMEARTQIILPPGGVASRLTLWINGEERESAFGRRDTVRQAYGSVVRRSQDPALVTTAGPDRVLLQCFPVNPGTSMKVKVGFSLPMIPEGERMILQLPYLAERNFRYAPGMRASLWAESDAPIYGDSAGLRDEAVSADSRPLYAVRGEIAPEDFASLRMYVPSPNPGAVYRAQLAGVSAKSVLREAVLSENRLVSIVLDTSKQCAPLFNAHDGKIRWERVLEKLPDGVRVALFAGDVLAPPMSREEAIRTWPSLISGVKFDGADEQTYNIIKALDVCSANDAVLWIHGNLPVEIADISRLEQRERRRRGDGETGSPVILSLQMIPGPNRIEERMPRVTRLPEFYGMPPEERLSVALANSQYPRLAERELIFSVDSGDTQSISADIGASQGSPHIARIAFAEDVARKLHAGADSSALENEILTAVNLRLVTPVTGAVVLENAEQFAAHDLNPAAGIESVPTIPEPEEWALLMISLAFLLIMYMRGRFFIRKGGSAL
ncbi:MAG: hypothetical protein LBQ58_05280 [Synergistaceae bacterium]|nr:hypothetical protein [Synergistaceae bacterium]